MQDHIHQHLGDALRAVTLIGAFTDDAGFDDYVADDLLKSAVERQFQIIGRILATLASEDPATATAGQAITVDVDIPFQNVSWLPAPWFMGGKSLAATSVMRKEGF